MNGPLSESEIRTWKAFLDEKLTVDILKTGYLCLDIPESFKLAKVTPDNSSSFQYSVMYTPCDIRELALYCGKEQDHCVFDLLKLIFDKLLVLAGVYDAFYKINSVDFMANRNEDCKRRKLTDDIKDGDASSASASTLKISPSDLNFYTCRTVSVNSHSLPLSTPVNWLNCEDIEHVLHTVKDSFEWHDMFYICIPLRLKHSCIHEDKDRIGINVTAQKEMVILLTEKFSCFLSYIANSAYFNKFTSGNLQSDGNDTSQNQKNVESGDTNCHNNGKITEPGNILKPVDSKNWNRFYPTNSLRVGIFMSLKISTVNLYKFNPELFQTPLFINPFYNSSSCPSCYFSWLRLLKCEENQNSKNCKRLNDIKQALNKEEMLTLALEAKVRVFLNGSFPCDNYVKARRVSSENLNNGESSDGHPVSFVGEAVWPGITSKGAFNPKVIAGLVNSNSMVLGVKYFEGDGTASSDFKEDQDEPQVEPNNQDLDESGREDYTGDDDQAYLESRENIIENDQWTQGGEIPFESKEKDLELVEKSLEDFILERINNTDLGCPQEDINEDPNDITIGSTKIVRICSKYTMVPYFGSRNIVKINDSQVHGSSALGISRNRRPNKDISINLLSKICSYLPLQDFTNFRLVCRTHCCRTIFNSYVQNLTLFESDLYLPILGQLYPLLSKTKSVTVIQYSGDNQFQMEHPYNQETGGFRDNEAQVCRVPPIAIQCLAAYTPKVKKMMFTHHSNANLAKIVSRASGRKPETIVLSQAMNQYLHDPNFSDGQDQEMEDELNNQDFLQSQEDLEDLVETRSNQLGNNGLQLSNSLNATGRNSQEIELSAADQPSYILQSLSENGVPSSTTLIEIHIIGNIESSNNLPTSLFRIPVTAPFRKLVRYFRDVTSIHEGAVDLYVLRYGIKDRLIPDLSPIDYGIVRGPTVLFAIGYKTLQYSQKIWISLFLVGSPNFPYLPKLRFNASMSTPFSRLAESYSRNVNISASDIIFIYKDSEIDLNLSPLDYNVSENDTIEVILRTKINDA
ncbi:Ubiquitin domain at the C-terminus, related [Cryptosporidium felis]|nr:Ubiquitin domain at the C-terminus, related [Cryptosporidium felis]